MLKTKFFVPIIGIGVLLLLLSSMIDIPNGVWLLLAAAAIVAANWYYKTEDIGS